MPSNALEAGRIRSDAEEVGQGMPRHSQRLEENLRAPPISHTVEKVTREVGPKNIVSGTEECAITSLLYLTASFDQSLSPIPSKRHRMCSLLLVGEHLHDNLEALSITLSPVYQMSGGSLTLSERFHS